jgi:hypothetical protein
MMGLISSFPVYFVAPGIFTHSPKQAPGAQFRISIDMGETSMSSTDVRREVQALGEHFPGTSYHIVLKNCNHFSKEFVLRLTGQAIPSWVNRLANMGSLVSCLLPKGMGVHHPESSDVQSQSTLDRYRYSPLAAKSSTLAPLSCVSFLASSSIRYRFFFLPSSPLLPRFFFYPSSRPCPLHARHSPFSTFSLHITRSALPSGHKLIPLYPQEIGCVGAHGICRAGNDACTAPGIDGAFARRRGGQRRFRAESTARFCSPSKI